MNALRTFVFIFLALENFSATGQTSQVPGVPTTPNKVSEIPTASVPVDNSPLVEQLKKTVVFITGSFMRGVQTSAGIQSQPQMLSGTGYILSVPTEDTTLSENFLVTNKHMIREPGPDGTLGLGPFLSGISVRVNSKTPVDGEGDSFYDVQIPVMDSTGQLYCFVDTEDLAVDLAICPMKVDIEKWDTKSVSPQLFVDSKVIKAEGINESDEVLFAGLFAPYRGIKKNYPIVRHGKLAMLTAERIAIGPDKTAEVYLADVMSFGGNSGSPVLVRTGGFSDQGISPAKYFLLGTMQGFFPVASPVTVSTSFLQGYAAENTGIALIVPAGKISEILALPQAKIWPLLDLAGYYENNKQPEKETKLCKEINEQKSVFPAEYSWLTFSIELKLSTGCKAYLGKQQVNHPSAILPTVLWWRNNLKSVVKVVLFVADPAIVEGEKLFLVGQDDLSYYFLNGKSEEIQGTPIKILKSNVKNIELQ